MKKRLLGFALFMVMQAAPAGADEFHYNNLLIGERSAGLGGAYTAVADDPSGLYYNPAGVVYTTGRKLSASVNTYYSTETVYKNALGGANWVRKSSSLLPNFFGIVQPLGKGVVGFSYCVPDSVSEDQNQTFSNLTISGTGVDKFVINFKKEDNTYLFGPTYAQELGEGFSMGLSVYFLDRRKKVINNQVSYYSSGTVSVINAIAEKQETGIKPTLGLMWTPQNSKVSLGLTLAHAQVLSDYDFTQTAIKFGTDSQGNPSSGVTVLTGTPRGKRKYPTELKVGGAWFPSHSLMVTGDVSYFTSVKDDYGTKESVMNVAVGVEYYTSPTMAIRGGFYTDRSNSPSLGSADSNDDDHLDIYGLSASVSFFTRNTSLTLGGTYRTGSGQAKVVSGISDTQDISYSAFAVFLATSYSF